MIERYFFYYNYSGGKQPCVEGPYSLDEALKRRLDLGQIASNWIELEKQT